MTEFIIFYAVCGVICAICVMIASIKIKAETGLIVIQTAFALVLWWTYGYIHIKNMLRPLTCFWCSGQFITLPDMERHMQYECKRSPAVRLIKELEGHIDELKRIVEK